MFLPYCESHSLPLSAVRDLDTPVRRDAPEPNVQFMSNTCSLGFRCGVFVVTRVPQVLHFIEMRQVRILLRPGLTPAVLQRIAGTRSDTEAARRMQQAKRRLFASLRPPAKGPWK